jgi:hypothetical protein
VLPFPSKDKRKATKDIQARQEREFQTRNNNNNNPFVD